VNAATENTMKSIVSGIESNVGRNCILSITSFVVQIWGAI
jgi:hypothetical protein